MFLMTKILGFDVLLTNLMIVKISSGHLGRHLELQLFAPYLKLAPKIFVYLLGVLYNNQKSKLGDIFLHTGPP